MAIWITRPDLGDPATLAHANGPDPAGMGRPSARGRRRGAAVRGLRTRDLSRDATKAADPKAGGAVLVRVSGPGRLSR